MNSPNEQIGDTNSRRVQRFLMNKKFLCLVEILGTNFSKNSDLFEYR